MNMRREEMAYYNDTVGRADFVERVLGAAARVFATAAERRAAYRAYRVTLNELQQLSGRELAALGLHRSELKRIAWETAHDAAAR